MLYLLILVIVHPSTEILIWLPQSTTHPPHVYPSIHPESTQCQSSYSSTIPPIHPTSNNPCLCTYSIHASIPATIHIQYVPHIGVLSCTPPYPLSLTPLFFFFAISYYFEKKRKTFQIVNL